jgi:crotonobetainyl-CoA:carnitine CoA-transferase CaiB-like acyl-CoA transferase
MGIRLSAERSPLPLDGLKVLDCATLFAGPVVATIMGDFGADVIKIEHPQGDSLRGLGWEKDGVSLWWSVAGRNKRNITLRLSHPEGGELLKELVAEADVLIENFRPGTFERWGLGPDVLHEINPGLVMLRITGFGQTGPYSKRPGFGTLAEAMSGYAHINGWPDGPPTLPPFALGDGVAALTGAYAAMFALWWREHGGAGKGQVIDLSILESLFSLLGPQATVYDQLGLVQYRTGNATTWTAPRNLYRAADDRWLALSASAHSIAERVMHIVDRPDVIKEDWFATHAGRVEHIDELDAIIQAWIGERTSDAVIEAFAEFDGAIAPVYSIKDIFDDPQFAARDAIVSAPHPQLGPVRMQAPNPRLSLTPGRISYAGLGVGSHNRDVLERQLGLSQETIERLELAGVIRTTGAARTSDPVSET